MTKKKYITLKGLMHIGLLALAAENQASAQNLVPNGDFEQHSKCPSESAQLSMLSNWQSVSEATPDLLCQCATKFSLVNAELNFAGGQAPHSGECFAGILAFHSDEYYEYLSVKLSAPLAAGKKYKLSFFYTLSDYSNKQVTQLGAFFSPEQLQYPEQPKLTEYSLSDSIVNNIRVWKEFGMVYTAAGGEQHLAIGCFTPRLDRAYSDTPPEGYGPRQGDYYAYYYIDDVTLTEFKGKEITSKGQTQAKGKIFDAALKKPFRLEKIYFDTDKSELLPASFSELNQLAEYLKANPSYKISISGHTDNTGKKEANQLLSLNRAKAVADYLAKKGIDKKRITATGHGSEKPVAPNDTDANKQKNRRVEFTLSGK